MRTREEHAMGDPVTHFEIVGRDAGALQAFYRDAFGWEVTPAGPGYAMVLPGAGTGINGGVGTAPEGGDGPPSVTISTTGRSRSLRLLPDPVRCRRGPASPTGSAEPPAA